MNSNFAGGDDEDRIDYERLKAMAKELGCSVKDLLVLAPQNDPFYVGMPAQVTQANWFTQIWNDGGFRHGAHLRRIHYWAVSQGGLMMPPSKKSNGTLIPSLPYENTEYCWGYLLKASKLARYLHLVPLADFADHKNPPPTINSKPGDPKASFWIDVPDLHEPDFCIQGFDPLLVQPYLLEVWIEKSSMNEVLLPLCKRYGANLVTGEGEMSISSVHDLMRRIYQHNKPARIFYISDFDPAGKNMPRAVARKIEWMLTNTAENFDVKLTPIALTREQIDQFQLPRIPLKDTERRADKFEAEHGAGAVELDALEALHPGEMHKIVKEALAQHYDEDAAREAAAREEEYQQAIRDEIGEITDRYASHIQALEQMRRELGNIEIGGDDYVPERGLPLPEHDAKWRWLYGSERSYDEQLTAYKG